MMVAAKEASSKLHGGGRRIEKKKKRHVRWHESDWHLIVDSNSPIFSSSKDLLPCVASLPCRCRDSHPWCVPARCSRASVPVSAWPGRASIGTTGAGAGAWLESRFS